MRYLSCFFLLLFVFVVASAFADDSQEPPVLIYESPYAFEKTISNLKGAIARNNFRFIREQMVDDGFVDGEKHARHYALYFCNFGLLDQALRNDKRIGFMLPCRITVSEINGSVRISALNPKLMSQFVGEDRMDGLCDRVKEGYEMIIEEATL